METNCNWNDLLAEHVKFSNYSTRNGLDLTNENIAVLKTDCMMIIIMHGALLSQALTDSARKQCED